MEKKELPKIEAGYRVGKLEVTRQSEARKNGYRMWECRCVCGESILLDTRTLQRGAVQSCGCAVKGRSNRRDLTGQRFGQLVVLEATQKRGNGGALLWRCRCDCGKICETTSGQLTAGYKKSCGCLGKPPLKDFVGKRFGQLTIVEYAGKVKGMHRWKCVCDCGQETTVGQTLLQSGKTKSCGCLQTQMAQKNMQFVEGTSVTRLEKAGKKLSITNTSGHTGVYWNKKSGKWAAKIGFQGKNYYLGSYDNLDDAIDAREEAQTRIYGAFLEWYKQTHTT